MSPDLIHSETHIISVAFLPKKKKVLSEYNHEEMSDKTKLFHEITGSCSSKKVKIRKSRDRGMA